MVNSSTPILVKCSAPFDTCTLSDVETVRLKSAIRANLQLNIGCDEISVETCRAPDRRVDATRNITNSIGAKHRGRVAV